ncbi:hypothetical protein ILUMI_18931, partial [Ignelater luminosus]
EYIPKSKLLILGNTSYCVPHKDRIQHNIIESIVHPKFRSPDARNDIALVKVRPPFTGKNEKPIKLLPISRHLRQDEMAYTMGWGERLVRPYPGLERLQLHYVQVKLFTREECDKIFGNLWYYKLPPEGICAGWVNKHKSTCYRDDGGPLCVLLRNNNKFEYFQIGKKANR